MIPLDAPELRRISRCMARRDPKSTVTMLAGLLTVPEFQANTIRLETLVHLATVHCKGRSHPNRNVIDNWVNKRLGSSPIARLEDPVEDVYITNVGTPGGNFLLFQSQWESSDYYVQTAVDVLAGSAMPHKCQRLLAPVFALLTLSDCVANRLGLQRWHSDPSSPQGAVTLPSASQLDHRARAVTFNARDLITLEVNRTILQSFVLRDHDKHALASDTTGHSSLERRPIVELDGDLVLALPHAVSPAIRRFILTELRRLDLLSRFSQALDAHQVRQVDRYGLLELKGKTESLPFRVRARNTPPLHSILFKHDTGKYINVVVLHDSMDRLDTHGLTSVMEYPDRQMVGLEKYLSRVTRHCRSLSGFTEGMTLFVFCGLGGGFSFGLRRDLGDWRLSSIRISDLLMLGADSDRPITRYLKFIKQKGFVERRGVHVLSIDGDYNLYCYWQQNKFRLVPQDVPLSEGYHLVVPTNSVLPTRKEIRNLTDRHVLQTTDGSNVPVIRLGVDAPFKSLQGHRIYASLSHLDGGRLGGAVETSRGTSWFLVKPRQGGENVRHFLYQMWTGFIYLYGKLILEIEAQYAEVVEGTIGVELSFDDVIVPVDNNEFATVEPVGSPRIAVNRRQQTAEVIFPPDLFSYFRQPGNAGERLVLRSIGEALMRIYHIEVSESSLEALVDRVIDHSGMRILHVFSTHDAVAGLLGKQHQDPSLCAYENFIFSKLGLSDGCTSGVLGNRIESIAECNTFLHCVARKVCDRLRAQLRQFSRVSVIRNGIEAHEAAIQDRVHWRWTAQAIFALYAESDDVHAIAQERESDRTNISIAVRTILEMAICECPTSGGRELCQWDLDDLIAEAWLLIQVATDSDAIYSGLTEPMLELHANGEYSIDRHFHETVINPFMAAFHNDRFEEAARKYSELYRSDRPDDRKRADEVLSPEFIIAFRIEFGLTPDDVLDGLEQLMALAVERDSIVVETTLGNIKKRLSADGALTSDACEAFIRTFSIFHRPDWDKPPRGFDRKDVYPWRFRRRLSSTFRPILSFGEEDGDKSFFGLGALRRGCMHLLERIECGHLPQEFFDSSDMKQYIGSVSHKRGHAFARSVAGEMRKSGWKARHEVQMTELGAPAKLGDVDVVAWKPTGDVQIIECKRLQLARTVAEVAEICGRFRGEAKDDLDKHVQRVQWIRANPTCLQEIVGFVPVPTRLDDRLVTNTHVPMTYLKSLPINADKIGPLVWSNTE